MKKRGHPPFADTWCWDTMILILSVLEDNSQLLVSTSLRIRHFNGVLFCSVQKMTLPRSFVEQNLVVLVSRYVSSTAISDFFFGFTVKVFRKTPVGTLCRQSVLTDGVLCSFRSHFPENYPCKAASALTLEQPCPFFMLQPSVKAVSDVAPMSEYQHKPVSLPWLFLVMIRPIFIPDTRQQKHNHNTACPWQTLNIFSRYKT